MSKLTIGYRQNNPGNLRHYPVNNWQGLVLPLQTGAFARFDTLENGARAASKDVKGDIERRGQNTVRRLLEAYAPKIENNTEAYIKTVAGALGISDQAPLSWPLHGERLMMAIFKHENGYIIEPEKLKRGIALA